MNTLQTNYQALVTEENEVPHESVIFHAASEGGKRKWYYGYLCCYVILNFCFIAVLKLLSALLVFYSSYQAMFFKLPLNSVCCIFLAI